MSKKLILALSLASFSLVSAKENVNGGKMANPNSESDSNSKVVAGDCSPGNAQTELDINNVRTRILAAGDMWWDLTNAKYEIPKGSNSHSMFAGSLWVGGYDATGQLHVAAATYRQTGNDFWPGPLGLNGSDPETSSDICVKYDKHFKITRKEVDEFYAGGAPTSAILNYPGNGDQSLGQLPTLAPFEDLNSDGFYDPSAGDFPRYNVSGASISKADCKNRLFGDQTLWWVFNDKGNIHSETTGKAIGMEIRGQAFSFSTNDELNDMTFYNFQLINRGTFTLDSTYFGVWVDADLGNYSDDYIGCDVQRGLGYIYNGDNYDEDQGGQIGYHDKLPALGCDFFQGPVANIGDGIDNDKDGCTDCTYYVDPTTGQQDTTQIISELTERETISMSKFLYYNNDGSPQGNPTGSVGNGAHFYQYITGTWKDGQPMVFGGDGYPGHSGATAIPTNYMFPGDSDPDNFGTNGTPAPFANWSETNTGAGSNQPADRRFLQSAGPFTLIPGAVNYITYGLPWARTTQSGNNTAAVTLLKLADDKAQALFDNCFKVLDGPDAPDLTVQELENELVIYLTNKQGVSNNHETDRYHELDVTISSDINNPYKFYDFEGYMVYQLKDGTVSQTDLTNPDKARLIFQSDIQNGVSKLVNYTNDQDLGLVPKLMVTGEDKGIKTSFKVTQDQFASGNKTLVNHKTYYFMAVSYAYNEYLKYVNNVSPSYTCGIDGTGTGTYHCLTGDFTGQKTPFLLGRRNIQVYAGIPHNISVETNGTIQNSVYGSGPKITRIEGQGNGGNYLELTQSSIDAIFASTDNRVLNPTYEGGAGPINVKVVDPLKLTKADLTLKMVQVGTYQKNKLDETAKLNDTSNWVLSGTYIKDGSSFAINRNSTQFINLPTEQLVPEIGISLTISQVSDPRVQAASGQTYIPLSSSSIITSSLTFSDPNQNWLTGVADRDGQSPLNWVRSGKEEFGSGNIYNDYLFDITGPTGLTVSAYADPDQVAENIVGGTWAPPRLCASADPSSTTLQGYPVFANTQFKITNIDMRGASSVDVVLTSDQTKWSRCPVLDLAEGANKFKLRTAASVGKDGNPAIDADNNDFATGMSWFPGYAINVETGERLTIAFGENTADATNNGNDMLWNPTSTEVSFNGTTQYDMGGRHYIYVFNHNGDGVFNTPAALAGTPSDVNRYDAGVSLRKMLETYSTTGLSLPNRGKMMAEIMRDAMWVNIPLLKPGFNSIYNSNKAPTGIPSDAKVRIRVTKPYRYGYSTSYSKFWSDSVSNTSGTTSISAGAWPRTNYVKYYSTDTTTTPQNNNLPMYTFKTDELVQENDNTVTAKDGLAKINVVPNPYYGYSTYEKTRIDNIVKIVNLPVKCKIRIYNVSGTLVRTIDKDTDESTYVDWDLKNQKSISIASGLYIIHVEAPGVGEKIIKWFGVMRPLDLQSY